MSHDLKFTPPVSPQASAAAGMHETSPAPRFFDRCLEQAWNQDDLLLDVAEGEPEDFSLAAGDNLQVVTLPAACATPATSDQS
jgi:hypothetical protein